MDDFIGFSKVLNYGLYLRSVIITFYALVLFRITSVRLIGEYSTFDFIISIVLGAILGEAVVESLPLLPAMITCAIIVIVHRMLAYLTYKSRFIGKYIKGEKMIIFQNGQYDRGNLHYCHVTENDILQSLRTQHSTDDISGVDKAILERNGEISFIFKDKSNNLN